MDGIIKRNISEVRERIGNAFACRKLDNGPVLLVAVSKFQPQAAIDEAIGCGLKIFGESRVQEARLKCSATGNAVQWHMIGHLQTNKVRQAVAIFDVIQSVDSERLVMEINREAARAGKIQQILLQVNVAGEDAKFGAALPEAKKLLALAEGCENITVRGLMTITPDYEIKEQVRPDYAAMAKLFGELQPGREATFNLLSMGMSGDYDIAVEEGANVVRVGTAIFGGRQI